MKRIVVMRAGCSSRGFMVTGRTIAIIIISKATGNHRVRKISMAGMANYYDTIEEIGGSRVGHGEKDYTN